MVPSAESCSFCDIEGFRRSQVFLENDYALYASDGFALGQSSLPGRGVIVPLAHRLSPFDLRREEWDATYDLLLAARGLIERRWQPDGYTIGWNAGPASGQLVAHAHLHVVPRFADEPCAGRGLLSTIKQPDNLRPDPDSAGQGLAANPDGFAPASQSDNYSFGE